MHSSLRDKYERRAFCLNTCQIGVSLFLCVCAFIGDKVLQSYGLVPGTTRLVLGFSALAILLLSITEFRVDWRSAGSRHAQAAARLAELNGKVPTVVN